MVNSLGEGRKEGRNERTNPHLASSRRIDPTFLNFGDCLVGVWRVSKIVWQMSDGSLEGVLRVSGRCLEGVWRVSMGCLNGNLVMSG